MSAAAAAAAHSSSSSIKNLLNVSHRFVCIIVVAARVIELCYVPEKYHDIINNMVPNTVKQSEVLID